MIYILIEAGDLSTGRMWASRSIAGLLAEVKAEFYALREKMPNQSTRDENERFDAAYLSALRNALWRKEEWRTGRHDLLADEPVWPKLTLIVTDIALDWQPSAEIWARMPAWAAQWCTGTPGGRLEFWQNEPYLSGSGRGWTTDALICGAHRVSGELLPVGIDWRTAKWKRPEMTPGCNASDCAPVVDAPARDNRAWVAQRQWDLTMNIVCHLAQSTDERQHAELLAATLAALEAGGVVL